MRSIRLIATVCCVALLGCAHAQVTRPTGPTVEVALDEGAPSERPLTPEKSFETLMRFDPQLPSFQLRQMRLQLAQAGQISFNVYANADDHPGELLTTIDRSYTPGMCSDGKDGKWIIEDLSSLPPQKGAVWIGYFSRGGGGDPRLWATSNNSGAVFSRDVDPSTPLSAGRLPRTPILRVELSPTP